jgi:uncharacterized glyoxalase superfamily protein PhnB
LLYFLLGCDQEAGMNSGWKPQGYNAVSVYIVADGAQSVKIMHAEVRVGDTVVMIADSGGSYPPFPVWLHVYVPDVDAAYQAASEAGGVSVQEPVRKEHDPDKRGDFKDPAGNTSWVATQVA